MTDEELITQVSENRLQFSWNGATGIPFDEWPHAEKIKWQKLLDPYYEPLPVD